MRNINSYILATEFCPKRAQILAAAFLLCIDVSGIPISSIYFKFISDDWTYIEFVIAGYVFLVAIGGTFIPESPRFYYEKGEMALCREIILKMARINGAPQLLKENWRFDIEKVTSAAARIASINEDDDDQINKSEMSVTEESRIGLTRNDSILTEEAVEVKVNPISQIRANPRLLINLLIVLMAWIASSFNYFLISFSTKNLGGNIFINSTLVSIAGIVGKIITILGKNHLSTKSSLAISFALTLLFGLGLVFFEDGWIVSTCIGFVEIGLGMSFTLIYYINTEYFPPLFLSFAFAVSQFGARGFSILSYLLADLSAPIPMILLCVTTAIAFLSLVFLKKPEATGK